MTPDFNNRQFSRAQKDHQERFKLAAAYARRAVRMEPAYAELARRTMRKAYNIALSDWFRSPVISSIERIGKSIRIEAGDDVMVTKVRVQILNEKGECLEEGYALQRDPELCPEWWEYASKTEAETILAEAWDLAGNHTKSALT